MPLYTFRVLTSQGSAEMELGFFRDDAAVAYAERMSRSAQVEVWRASQHVKTVGTIVELVEA